jgi:hypothetical protein
MELELLIVVSLDGVEAGLDLTVLSTAIGGVLPDEFEPVLGDGDGDGLGRMFCEGVAIAVGTVALPVDDDECPDV